MATKKATKKGASKGTKKRGAAKKGAAKKTSKKATTKKAAAKKPITGKCTGWQAVQDSMPPGPSRLTVTGRCTFPTPGYKVTLRDAVPQGINPRILLLRKTVTPPKGFVPQVITTVPVRYVKSRATIKYTNVTILPDGTTIKVQQVV